MSTVRHFLLPDLGEGLTEAEVVAWHAAVGDEVTKGTPLLILEAMKMEHQLTAPSDGVVASINCKEGELVQPGLDLVTLS